MGTFSEFTNHFDHLSQLISNKMEYDYFFGCILVAYSFPLSLLVFFILPKAQLVVIAFTSALFYILAIIINSVLWKLLPFLQASSTFFVLISVMTIETIRCIYFSYFELRPPTQLFLSLHNKIMNKNLKKFEISEISNNNNNNNFCDFLTRKMKNEYELK